MKKENIELFRGFVQICRNHSSNPTQKRIGELIAILYLDILQPKEMEQEPLVDLSQ